MADALLAELKIFDGYLAQVLAHDAGMLWLQSRQFCLLCVMADRAKIFPWNCTSPGNVICLAQYAASVVQFSGSAFFLTCSVLWAILCIYMCQKFLCLLHCFSLLPHLLFLNFRKDLIGRS